VENCLTSRCGGRADPFQLPGRALVAPLAGSPDHELVGAVLRGGNVDVHAHRHQRRHEVRAPHRRVRGKRRAEREPGDERLATRAVAKQLQQCNRVVDHPGRADGGLPAQGQAGAPLVPVDDREVLLQPENLLETPGFVDDRQTGTLLHQQQHRVGRVRTAHTDPQRRVGELDRLERVDDHLFPPDDALPSRPLLPAAPRSSTS
jgi:hypothetical protein